MVHLECRVLWIFLCPTNLASKTISLMYFKLPILCSHNTPQSSLSVGLSMHFRIIKSLLITYTKQQTITKPSLSLHTNKGQSAFSPTSQPTQIPNFVSIVSSFKIVGFLKNTRPFWALFKVGYRRQYANQQDCSIANLEELSYFDRAFDTLKTFLSLNS